MERSKKFLQSEIFVLHMAWPSHYPPAILIDFPTTVAEAMTDKRCWMLDSGNWKLLSLFAEYFCSEPGQPI
jgi:hypothetical protein